ncbi:hypothetical protein EC957_006896, partial [Mortierella hygrophila]
MDPRATNQLHRSRSTAPSKPGCKTLSPERLYGVAVQRPAKRMTIHGPKELTATGATWIPAHPDEKWTQAAFLTDILMMENFGGRPKKLEGYCVHYI